MQKYDFSVKTRGGQRVDNIQIYGRDMADAERKLRQMYLHCEVLQHKTIELNNKLTQSADIEDVLSLISKND